MKSSSSSSSSSSTDNEDNGLLISAVQAAVQLIVKDAELSHPIQRRVQVNRDRAKANERLMEDYFNEDSVYKEKAFTRRFRMRRLLFLKIVSDLEQHDEYFQQRYDARGKLGFTTIQKCSSAIHQLSYGTASDSWDEYLKMADKISCDALYKFCDGVIKLYGKRYMRSPTFSDIQQLYEWHEQVHGLTGMLGSIDCTHWEWSNCPTGWRGQHQWGDHAHPTIMLEAVASRDGWIWHSFFGVAGSNNDINVLDQSHVFENIVDGTAPGSSFIANDIEYELGYHLADGIYPEWSTFVKSFTCPHPDDEKRLYFKKTHEAARKDVERAFGMLKKKCQIIANPSRMWTNDKIRAAMYTVLILHNMILEDIERAICQYYEEPATPPVRLSEEQKQVNRVKIRNREIHNNLKSDLVEHVWKNRDQ